MLEFQHYNSSRRGPTETLSPTREQSFGLSEVALLDDQRYHALLRLSSEPLGPAGLARFPSKATPAVDEILDHVAAPILYRILFTKQRPEAGYGSQLVAKLLGGTQSYDL